MSKVSIPIVLNKLHPCFQLSGKNVKLNLNTHNVFKYITMPKLYFRYGTMNSSKTANLLMIAHNYKSQNKKIILLKPKIDTRDGNNITSRCGLSSTVDICIGKNTNLLDIILDGIDCILVDEVQFLLEKHIDQLRILAQTTPVICYGLRTDYRTKMFEGSRRLLEIADTIEEVKTICNNCSQKATINSKYTKNAAGDKIFIKNGTGDIDIGAEEKYTALCWSCWTDL